MLSNMFRDAVLKYSLDCDVKAAGDVAQSQHDQFVKYRAFDMHHECSKGWDKAAGIIKLIDEQDLVQMAAGNRAVSSWMLDGVADCMLVYRWFAPTVWIVWIGRTWRSS